MQRKLCALGILLIAISVWPLGIKVEASSPIAILPACKFVESSAIVNANRTHHNDVGYEVDLGANNTPPAVNNKLKCVDDVALASISGTAYRSTHQCNGKTNTRLTIVNTQLNLTVSYIHVDLNDPITVANGQTVVAGQPIARISDKGCASFKHIHFTVYQSSAPIPADSSILSYQSNYSSLPNKWQFSASTGIQQSTNLDIAVVSKMDAGSNTTALHILNGSNGYQNFTFQDGTHLHQTGSDNNWNFLYGDYNNDGYKDLFALNRSTGGSNKTEVHILDGKTGYNSFIDNIATGLGYVPITEEVKFALGDYNADRRLDIYMFGRTDGGSNSTAIHILNGANRYQDFLIQEGTILHQTGSDYQFDFTVGDYNKDGKGDIFAISRMDGGSNSTAIHIMDASTKFKTFLKNKGTALFQTGNDNFWDFGAGDYDKDGRDDLIAINRYDMGSGKTVVYVLNGATDFDSMIGYPIITDMHQTGSGYNWNYSL
jgi:hypothetical protein